MKTAADARMLRELTAERIGVSYDELMKTVAPLEDIYTVCDHSRALMILLNDGVVPSNVREGYFARMLVRRALRSIRTLGLKIRLSEAVDRHIDYFKGWSRSWWPTERTSSTWSTSRRCVISRPWSGASCWSPRWSRT